VIFYGRIDASNPFDSVEFTSSSGEVFAFDQMTIGSVAQVVPSTVPEPISMTLLGTGLLGWERTNPQPQGCGFFIFR
jgi:hypothetical protein